VGSRLAGVWVREAAWARDRGVVLVAVWARDAVKVWVRDVDQAAWDPAEVRAGAEMPEDAVWAVLWGAIEVDLIVAIPSLDV